MTLKSSSFSESDSSPKDNVLFLTPSFIRDRDDRGWKAYFSNAELMTTASAIFSQINNSDDTMNNQVSFLYDYYGMTEESRQDPPSPGHSSPASIDEKEVTEGGIDIPAREALESPVLEMRHSFPESGRSSYIPYTIGQASEAFNLSKRHHSVSSVPTVKGEKSSPVSCLTCSSSSTATTASGAQSISRTSSYPQLQKSLFCVDEKYVFILEAQTSVVQKKEEDTLTYLNKGQFYYISFEAQPSKLMRVKSIIHLMFRDEKDPITELAHWKYWYNQQPNPNQRAFDIDRKSCQNIDEEIEEVGYNALAFTWNPNVRAKVSLRINCLSTDFSPQKGVKGIPFHLQIETYEILSKSADPVHRAFCQIKVFRDKGAERKNKDESKTVGKRMVKYLKQGADSTQGDMSNLFQMANKVTVLNSTTPFGPKSVIFSPIDKLNTKTVDFTASSSGSLLSQLRERESKRGFNTALSNAKDELENLDVYPKYKNAKVVRRNKPAVTIYVRKEEEKAYHAIMLETLTLHELKQEIARKYGVPEEMIKNVLKQTKKGILVNIDNQLIEQFVDEDDFVIAINFDNQLGHFDVVLSC